MAVQTALEHAEALRNALAAEVARSHATREAIRTLDASRLWNETALRATFNHGCEQLQRNLQQALDAGPGPGSTETESLGATCAQIRQLASALAEHDLLTHQLAGRAQACVDGYLGAMTVRPAAYNRRGARSTATASGTLSQRA